MSLNNTISEYGLVAKLFHWISFIILIIQIPLGFYLVKLDFSDTRITLEEYHVIFGIIISVSYTHLTLPTILLV